MELGKYISELLPEHDCVVIPGFGGFVANYAPASVHPTLHNLQPPYKRITFNKQLQNNDGLLANLIASKERTSFRHASELIKEQVSIIEASLSSGERVVLKDIGELYLDVEKNLRFEQDMSNNYYLGSFGFGSIQATPIVHERQKREKVFKNREQEAISINRTRKLVPYIAAAAVMLLVGVSIGISVIKNKDTNFAEMIGLKEVYSPVYSMRTDIVDEGETISPGNIAFYAFDLSEDETTITYSFIENRPSSGGVVVKVREGNNKEEKKPEETSVVPSVVADIRNYHIIAGAFRDYSNAEGLANSLRNKGYSSSVFDNPKNNLHMVSYGGFASRQDAIEELYTIQTSLNPNAWVYKSKN